MPGSKVISSLIFGSLLIIHSISFAQTVWTEDFNSYANGTTTGAGNSWTSSCGGCNTGDHFEVISGAFEALDVNAFSTWQSATIDVSACSTFTFSLDAIEIGDHEGPICACGINIDYFDVSYSINGGAYTLIENWNGDGDIGHTLTGDSQNGVFTDNDWGNTSVTATGLAGNSLALRVEMINTSGSERLRLDNITVSCETLLPAAWVFFEGKRKAGKVDLHWRFNPDEASYVFEIERSSNGRNFNRIHTITPQTETENTFQFTDISPLPGTSFYRIHHLDHSGNSSYSNVVAVSDDSPSLSLEVSRAHPAGDVLSVNLQTTLGQEVQLSLISLDGKIHFRQPYNIHEGNNRILLDVSHLSAGMYILQLQGKNTYLTHRLSKN